MVDFQLPYQVPGGQQVQFTPYALRGRGGGDALIVGSGSLKSENYVASSAGWRIDGLGNAEFESGEFRGDISGASGTFSGALDIGGSDATSFHVDANGNMWLGAGTFGAAPFTVNSAGDLTATSGTFSGTLTGAVITGTNVLTDAASNQIRSGDFSAGVAGWSIDGDGDAEFNNVTVRGTIYGDLYTGTSVGRVYISDNDATEATINFNNSSTGANISGNIAALNIDGPKASGSTEIATISLVYDVAADGFITYNGKRHQFTAGGTDGDGQIQAAAGSESAPSISFSGDSDSGLRQSSGLRLVSAGNDRIIFGSSHTHIRGGNNSSPSGRIYLETEDGSDMVSFDYTSTATRMIVPSTDPFIILEEGAGTIDLRVTGLPTTGSAANVFINSSTGQLARSTSNLRYKKNLSDYSLARDVSIEQLQPRRFKWKSEVEGHDHQEWAYGFIIEELAEIDRGFVDWSESEAGELEPMNIDLRAIVALLVAEVQDLRTLIVSEDAELHTG